MRFSAPGKILLLGGYSVLDDYPALSIAVEDRMGLGVSAECREGGFRVVSRQFSIDRNIDPEGRLADCRDSSSCAFMAALSYLRGKCVVLKPVTIETRNSLIFGNRREKSGLGSSAASTVAIVAAVLGWHGIEDMNVVHKVSQIANYLSTKKTGAGFDVACSVFGTIRYRRFGERAISLNRAGGDAFDRHIVSLVESDWPGMEVEPFSMGDYGILAFNIRGSRTRTIGAIKAMGRFKEAKPGDYARMVSRQAEAEELVFDGILAGDGGMVRKGMRKAREIQRRLSAEVEKLADFDPIEPKELTITIDEAEKLDGIVAGRCPGAGGYDSLAFIVKRGADEGQLAGRIAQIGKDAGIRLERIELVLSKDGVKRL
ncbi:MAG: hypothetical protein AB1295_01330 [Candidatus Micrarchaeota archaeon]